MSALDNLNARLNCAGGDAEGRIRKGKLLSLRSSLKNSYQSATIELEDHRQFKALINPDRTKENYDEKILSIPYIHKCLNTGEKEYVGIKPGDIFKWVDTDSYWLVYLDFLQELSYFRGEIKRCDNLVELEDGRTIRAYVRGPIEQSEEWHQQRGLIWNGLNYTALMYVPATEENLEYFHRFSYVKINGGRYEAAVVDKPSTIGIIEVYLTEYFNDTIGEKKKEIEEENIDIDISKIIGSSDIYPYSTNTYSIDEESGEWEICQEKNYVHFKETKDNECIIEVLTGKSAAFKLKFIAENGTEFIKEINIKSL